MCRSSPEVFTTLAGTGLASVLAMLRMHWDMLRDRKAFNRAKKRAEEEPSD